MPNVNVIVGEARRGCGYRKPGGMYLISDAGGFSCQLLPMEMTKCPCCGHGISPARGWTWIDPAPFLSPYKSSCDHCPINGKCPLSTDEERVGLIWIGEQFYKTPMEFSLEANKMGISRRISAVPKGFVLGKTPVWLGHRKGMAVTCPDCEGEGSVEKDQSSLFCKKCSGSGTVYVPAVFSAFIPKRIEYVITGEETEKQLESMEDRGITLVDIKRPQRTK